MLSPFAAGADQIEAVVPVARPDQWQAVAADRETLVEGSGAVFEQGAVLLGNRRLKVRLKLIGAQNRPFEEGNHLVENAAIAADLDVMGGGVRQPDAVVGNARADALAGRRMPPMLHVALGKLPRGRAQ